MKKLIIFSFAIIIFMVNCDSGKNGGLTDIKKISILTGIPPVKFLVENVGGDRVAVDVMIENNQNPHSLELLPSKIMAANRAQIYISAGLPFENQLATKIASGNQLLKIYNLGSSIVEKVLVEQSESEFEGDNQEGELDPHIWLSTSNLTQMVDYIAQILMENDPSNADYYRKNMLAFRKDIRQTAERIKQILSPYKGKSLLVYHPALGYFCREFGLNQIAIESGGKSPTPKHLNEIIRLAKKKDIKVIFIQPQFDPSTAKTFAAAIGGTVLQINPLAENILQNLEYIAHQAEKSFLW